LQDELCFVDLERRDPLVPLSKRYLLAHPQVRSPGAHPHWSDQERFLYAYRGVPVSVKAFYRHGSFYGRPNHSRYFWRDWVLMILDEFPASLLHGPQCWDADVPNSQDEREFAAVVERLLHGRSSSRSDSVYRPRRLGDLPILDHFPRTCELPSVLYTIWDPCFLFWFFFGFESNHRADE
jgi:hypothetical protein